jgi:hypothetical protein
MEKMLAAIWSRVRKLHSRLRLGFPESGWRWIVPRLDRTDCHFHDQGFNDSGPSTRPGDLFERNCGISFEPVEGASLYGRLYRPTQDHVATDYPHSDGFFPDAAWIIGEHRAPVS